MGGRFSVASTISSTPCKASSRNSTLLPRYSEAPLDLEAKAEQKCKFVNKMIHRLDKAIRNLDKKEEQEYLRKALEPGCFSTLIELLVAQKYTSFVNLRCAVLQAIQMILKVASAAVVKEPQGNRRTSTVGASQGASCGLKVMRQLAGEANTTEALRELTFIATESKQAALVFDAMVVLAELGPEAFGAEYMSTLMHKLIELFAVLPDRQKELTEVVLRAHAWGGDIRSQLLQEIISQQEGGSRYLGEVLLQVVNWGEEARQVRAAKILADCFEKPDGSRFIYTNDKRLLVELLLRELAGHAGNAAKFDSFAKCYQALISQNGAAREHQKEEAIQLFEAHGEDDRCSQEIIRKCTEVLAILKCGHLN